MLKKGQVKRKFTIASLLPNTPKTQKGQCLAHHCETTLTLFY